MSNTPNVGEIVTTSDGATGAAWGLRQDHAGVFVQFRADGDWRPVIAAPADTIGTTASAASAPAQPATAPASDDPVAKAAAPKIAEGAA
jgi:hypothetical protein